MTWSASWSITLFSPKWHSRISYTYIRYVSFLFVDWWWSINKLNNLINHFHFHSMMSHPHLFRIFYTLFNKIIPAIHDTILRKSVETENVALNVFVLSRATSEKKNNEGEKVKFIKFLAAFSIAVTSVWWWLIKNLLIKHGRSERKYGKCT